MSAPLAKRPARNGRSADGPVVIGLVNNMPDGALETTERQFAGLLRAAARGLSARVELRVFSIPDVPRGERGQTYVSEHCEPVDALWASEIDGLIVTGAEPRTPVLDEEPYWETLTQVIDWAEERTASSIWSCLAAHAAAHYLDGVTRRRFPEKLFGVFECGKAAEHALVAGMPERWRVPHSRYNDLPERDLVAAGHEVLSRSPEAGADMSMRRGKSLFLFLQGHPEYDAPTLLREYRRDVGRFLRGERETYPPMPENYFDAGTAAALEGFRERALQTPSADLLAELPAPETIAPLHPWHDAAVSLYGNWLSHLRADRAAHLS